MENVSSSILDHYYSCVPEEDGWSLIPGDCGDYLAFDPETQACTYPENVPGCSVSNSCSPLQHHLFSQ